MTKKINNFFSNPWIAFPCMVLLIVLFMYFGLKFDNWKAHQWHYWPKVPNRVNKIHHGKLIERGN